MKTPSAWGRFPIATLAVSCALLAGCASWSSDLRRARAIYDEGRVEEALAQMQALLKRAPNEPELRAAHLKMREGAVNTWLAQAQARGGNESGRAQGKVLYERVISIDPANARAQAGLKTIEDEAQQARLAENATAQKAVDLQRGLQDKNKKPVADTALVTAMQKPLTVEYRDATIKQVFETFSRTTGINFVFDKDVRTDQRTTVFLKNITAREAIDSMLLTNQLEQRALDRNTILIYPNTPAKLKDYQALSVRGFFLVNADAEQVANTLKTIVRTRDVIVDKKQNLLIMRDSPEAIRLAEKLVSLHDLPEPETMLEVEILEVNRGRLTELGIKLPEQLSLEPLAAAGSPVLLSDLRQLSSSSVKATVSPLQINAKGVDTDINLLANPRIRVRNRETAKILIGDKVPNITSTSTSTGFVAENIQYLDVGLKLEVTPVISINDEISIKVMLEVSNINSQVQTSSGTLAYQIGTRTASTTLRLKDGENQVLAGLINDEDRRTARKVPGMGDIPLLGRLFSSHLQEGKKNEIILSITPRLIRNISRPEPSALEFEAGTENSQRVTIASAVAPPPAATETVTPDAKDKEASAASAMRWRAPPQVKAGDIFTVQLLAPPLDQPLMGLAYTVRFNPAMVEVITVTEGEFFKQGGATSQFSQRVDRGSGQMFITHVRNGNASASGTASVDGGLLGVFTLRALTPSASAQLEVTSSSPMVANGAQAAITPPAPLTVTITP